MAAVSDLLLAESLDVRVEMGRLRDLHATFGLALRMAVRERLGPEATWAEVDAEAVRHVGEATAELLG